MTRIRTFDQRPLYVPNSVFSTVAIENPSRMLNRRIYETVGIRYDDIAVMADIVAAIKTMLNEHDDIDKGKTLMVNFVSLGPSSLDFFIYCFTRTTDWATYHGVKQDVLLKILHIIENHGAEVAFPTRTVRSMEPDLTTFESDACENQRWVVCDAGAGTWHLRFGRDHSAAPWTHPAYLCRGGRLHTN